MDLAFVPGSKAPRVTVQYPDLVKQAGGNVVGDTIQSNTVTIESTKRMARRKLEERILGSGTGEVEAFGAPKPRPYDRLESRPECNNLITTDVPVLPYQISEVTHQKAATPEYGPAEMRTFLKTSPVVDTSEMEVKEATMMEV